MKNLKFVIYSGILSVLPNRLCHWIGQSSSTGRLREWFFRPDEIAENAQGTVCWEDTTFLFSAPYQVLYRAQRRGIENRICRLARSVIHPSDTAIDVGANYGFVTLAMAPGVRPSGVVVSFEIAPKVREVLERNVVDNNRSGDVMVIPKGAGSSESEELTTIDSLVERAGLQSVSFIKIDVDGSELAVLQGATKTLSRFQPVVVVELNKDCDEIFDRLIEAGYTYFSDLNNSTIGRGNWPANLIAAVERVSIPSRGSISK